MKYYQELTLIPDVEIPLNFLQEKVFAKLHLAFVQAKENKTGIQSLGISFPNYINEKENRNLGNKIRIFSKEKETLEKLNLKFLLKRFSDFVHVTSIRNVPEEIKGYEIYQRRRKENSPYSKARRYSRKHQVSYDEALKLFINGNEPHVNYPFVKVKSYSSGESYNLYVKREEVSESCFNGFTSYGLSREDSTVPMF